jgi:hypothetical protein
MKTRLSRQEILKEIRDNQLPQSTNVHLESSSPERFELGGIMLSMLLLPVKLGGIPPLHSSVHDNILLLIIDVKSEI